MVAEPELLAGRYEIVRTLSEGPRASVYQAIDRVHGKPVALKIHPVVDDADEDLPAEARVLMNLPAHRGVPEVRGDFFVDDPRRYVVVMKWIEGTNLQDVLDDDGDPGLPLPEVLDALEQVAVALDHLHSQDPPVVHGDVKPENLVREAGGHVVLVDFEISAESASARVGTTGYIAPEVSAGEKPTPRADVYALAATAIALLNGHGPLEATPTYPGLPPAVQGQIARVLRSGIAPDPDRRPKSATRLVANLRSAAAAAPPSGVVALLACEVADAGRLWADDNEGMRVAMGRLRDVEERVVDEAHGWVAASMNEGDRTIAVFQEASAAARAALALHERIATTALPPGITIGLKVGLAVGEAELVNGVYVGAVVDQVIRLRGAADAGSTVMSEPTAELVVGLVGPDVAIVPLGTIDLTGAPGTRAFALRHPTAPRPLERHLGPRPVPSTPAAPAAALADATGPGPRPPGWLASPGALAGDAGRAMQTSLVLVALTVAGVAAIYAVVLSEELGFGGAAWAVVVIASVVASVAFVQRLVVAVRPRRRAARAALSRWELDVERTEARRLLSERLAAAAETADAVFGADVLDRLGTEVRAVIELLQRERTSIVDGLLEGVPQLVDDTYTHGITAVTEAVQLFELAGVALRVRLDADLRDVDRRTSDPSLDEDARVREEQRRASLAELARRHDDARTRARDLLHEAERCAMALGETRVGLASVRRDDDRPPLDQVIGPLEDSITRVRAVQDELRQLGY